jgi:hypothetical protein
MWLMPVVVMTAKLTAKLINLLNELLMTLIRLECCID